MSNCNPADSLIAVEQPAYDRATINRENAKKSTGPVSAEGRATSALNALKHGLTGNTVLLAADDAEAYQQRLDDHVAQWKPVTFEERRLVQSIHDSAWRLDRIVNLESTIFAKGRIELQECFYALPEEQRKSFIQLEIADRNEKKLRNLCVQEGRLQRQRARDIAALKQLIQQRRADEDAAADAAKTLKSQPELEPSSQNGFDFSTSEIELLRLAITNEQPLDKVV